MSEEKPRYGKNNKEEFTPPVTRDEAYKMIRPLRPMASDATMEEKVTAYNRLTEFIDLILPE